MYGYISFSVFWVVRPPNNYLEVAYRYRVTQPQDRVQHREANGVQLISLKFAGCGRHKIQYKKNLSMDLIHCFFILKVVCIPTILSYDLVLCDRLIFIEKQCEFFIFSFILLLNFR